MYKGFAALNGAIIAIMILSNGIMAEIIGNIPAAFVNHGIGLVLMFIIYKYSKTKWHTLKGIPIFYLLAGITGVFTVIFTNIAFLSLGATVALMLSMVARITTSSVIDHFGLMGMRKYPFKPVKLIGLGLMAFGLVFIFM